MNGILFWPPIAFVIYLVLIAALVRGGRVPADAFRGYPGRTATYAGGEDPPSGRAVPGYRAYFMIALFFAVLHLGALMLATSDLSPIAAVYAAGLLFVLVALILG